MLRSIYPLTSIRSLQFFITLCLLTAVPFLMEAAANFTVEDFAAKDLPPEYGTYDGSGKVTVIKVTGTEEGKFYKIEQKRISKPKTEFPLFMADKEPLSKIIVTDEGYIPGEPIEFSIQEIGKMSKKSIKVVPLPIVAISSVDQAQIEAVVIILEQPTYMITFKGFNSDEVLDFQSKSYNEVLKQKSNPRDGMMFLPAVIGKQGGIAELTFKRKSGEVLKMELPWGFEWMKYRAFYDENGEKKMCLDDPDFQKQFPDVVKYFESKQASKSLQKASTTMK